MSEDKKLGLGSVVSISVGLVIATSCLVSLGQGAGTVGVVFIFSMIIACTAHTDYDDLSRRLSFVCHNF